MHSYNVQACGKTFHKLWHSFYVLMKFMIHLPVSSTDFIWISYLHIILLRQISNIQSLYPKNKYLFSCLHLQVTNIMCFLAEHYTTVSEMSKCARFRHIFICLLINSIHITQCILPGFVGLVISRIAAMTKQCNTLNQQCEQVKMRRNLAHWGS